MIPRITMSGMPAALAGMLRPRPDRREAQNGEACRQTA